MRGSSGTRSLILAGALLLAAGRVEAQFGPYVVGAASLDVTRTDHSDSQGLLVFPPAGGEVPGGSVRAGTPLGDRFGAELEFAWSGRVESESPQRGLLGGYQVSSAEFSQAILGLGLAPTPINFTAAVHQRNTSINAAIWVRQSAGERVDLAYLGGVAFGRNVQESTLSIRPLLTTIALPIPISQGTRVIDYGVAPLVGAEARIRLMGKLRLVPGVRLQGLTNGWLLRAAVGLGWFF